MAVNIASMVIYFLAIANFLALLTAHALRKRDLALGLAILEIIIVGIATQV